MIITIARQCGCNAIKVGEVLSQKYNLPLYTRQNLMLLAKGKGMLSEMCDFFEEAPVDDLMNAITTFTEEHEGIRKHFMRSFNSIIGDSDCIIIGRCGNRIFEQRKDLISVFLHAELQMRINNIAKEQGLSAENAKEFVMDMDCRRTSYHKFYTGHTWGDAADYDISIDCCRLGVSKTAALIEEYIKNVEDYKL